MRLRGLPDEFSGLLVSVAGAVRLDPRPVDGAPLSLGVVRVEHRHELIAWELIACAAVLRLVLLRADVGRARPPEWLALDLHATGAARLLTPRVPLASAAVQPAGTYQRLSYTITRSSYCINNVKRNSFILNDRLSESRTLGFTFIEKFITPLMKIILNQVGYA